MHIAWSVQWRIPTETFVLGVHKENIAKFKHILPLKLHKLSLSVGELWSNKVFNSAIKACKTPCMS